MRMEGGQEWSGPLPRAAETCLLSADYARLLDLQVTQMCCFKPQNIVAHYTKAGVLKCQLWQSKQSSNVSISQCPAFMGKESTHQEREALTGEQLPTARVETQTWQSAPGRTKAKPCESAPGCRLKVLAISVNCRVSSFPCFCCIFVVEGCPYDPIVITILGAAVNT